MVQDLKDINLKTPALQKYLVYLNSNITILGEEYEFFIGVLLVII